MSLIKVNTNSVETKDVTFTISERRALDLYSILNKVVLSAYDDNSELPFDFSPKEFSIVSAIMLNMEDAGLIKE